MKICVVAPYFAPLRGGVESYSMRICERLIEDFDHEVFVVSTGLHLDSDTLEVNEGIRSYLLPAWVRISNTPLGLTWHSQLRRIFLRERPDVIWAHTPVPGLSDVAERARNGIPFVLTYHNDIEKESRLSSIGARLYYRLVGDRTLSRSDWVLATSVHYAEGSKHLAAVREKVSIATCGVDLGTFYHRELLDEKILDEMTGREVVLFVGSLDPSHSHKGLDVLIRAVAAIKNHSNREALLVVVGEGDARDSYEVLARDTGASVKFVGGVKDDCLAQLYTIAKVCVLPSTNRSEGLGLVLIEAAACGTAVIGSAIGGIPHAIVDGETGILVLPADEKSLAEAIEYLLVDDERARALGAAGRERVVREFSWDASASVTNEALVSAVNRAVEEQGTTSALSE